MSISFAIAPLSSQASYSFIGLILGLLVVLVITYVKCKTNMSRYASLGVLLPIIGAFSYLFIVFNSAKVTVNEEALVLDIPFYGFELPLETVDIEQSRKVDIEHDSQLTITRRVNGIGLPSFQYGWFALASHSKAFVVQTDKNALVYIPTSKGYPLLLSLEHPQDFIRYLQAQKSR